VCVDPRGWLNWCAAFEFEVVGENLWLEQQNKFLAMPHAKKFAGPWGALNWAPLKRACVRAR
jgi:hypothetical protein